MSTVIPFDRARVAELVRGAAWELRGSPRDYDPLIELIGDARLVLLGEASHGTHEVYRERAIITRTRTRCDAATRTRPRPCKTSEGEQ